MALISPVPKLQFFDNNGDPLVNGKLYAYQAGTTTPQDTYSDSSGTLNTNPVILNSRGEANVWLGTNLYKFVLKDSTGATIWTEDNIGGAMLYGTITGSGGSALIGFLQSGAGAVARTVQAKLRDVISVKDFGAVGSGAVNDRAAFLAADAVGTTVHVPAGSYLISSSMTLTSSFVFDKGAVLIINTGVTVAFQGAVQAAPYQIFNCSGTGAVTFDGAKTTTGYAEWWGAVTGGPDCSTAINAAIKALLKVQLLAGDYFCSTTVVMDTPHRELAGSGYYFADTTNQVTRVIISSASLDAIRVGPSVEPATINDFQKQNYIHDLFVERDAQPSISSTCSQIKVQYTLGTVIDNVRARNGIYCFQFYGTVGCKLNNCYAARDAAGSGGGTDQWFGYYINGLADIGAAGGNASIYLNYCAAACNIAGLKTGYSVGFYANGAFTDCFMESPETVDCNVGIQVLGNSSTSLVASNTDMQIKNPINDAFHQIGIFVQNVNEFGSVSIESGYNGPASDADQCVLIDNCLGSVRIAGGQYPCAIGTSAGGVAVNASKGVVVDRTQILESSTYGVSATDAVACYFAPIVKNYQLTLANAGVQLISGCDNNFIQPQMYGDSGLATLGVQLVGTTNGHNEVNCTMINPTVVSGGSANKLTINGVQITTTGLSGTNLVSGVMN